MNSLIRALCLSPILTIAATTVRAAPIPCMLSNPLHCPNTSDLTWAPGFAGAITQFIGGRKASYFRRNGSLSSQALFGLRGPPDERKAVPGKLFLFSACPAHQCGGQAAAVMLDSDGVVKAIGFSSFHCEEHCDLEHRYLDFYVARVPDSDVFISALTAWGTGSSIRALLDNPHVDDGIEARTVTHLLP